jgi:hypothetical protein
MIVIPYNPVCVQHEHESTHSERERGQDVSEVASRECSCFGQHVEQKYEAK